MKNGIVKRGTTYSYVVRVPDPKTGKTKPKWFGGFKTESEAKQARDKARVSVGDGTYTNQSKISVEEFLLRWIEIHSATLKPRTSAEYEQIIRTYILPRIGKIQMKQVYPSTIQRLYTELLNSGGTGGAPLSARTVSYVGAILKKSFSYALDTEGIINQNVVKKVALPKGEAKRNEPFTVQEMKIFLEIAFTHRLYAFFRLAVHSGARKGELLALTWNDVNFDGSSISINKNRVVVNGKSLIQNSTKGGEGRRTVLLDAETMQVLASHRKLQLEDRLKAGSEWVDSDHVFVNEFGSPIDYGTPTQLFAKLRKRAGLREQRLHDLRHFHATQLLKAGAQLHVVAQRLGHRDPMVTATTYAHVTADQAANVAELFAKAVE